MKGLMHLLTEENLSGKIVKIRIMQNIKTIGVVGAGTMGSALAQKFAQEGFNVVLADTSLDFVENGISLIKDTLDEAVGKNIFTAEKAAGIILNIKGTSNLKELNVCDLVVEAIYEDLEAKVELFKQLSLIVKKDTIIATNTSSFSVTDLSAGVTNPERFIGMHYFYHAAKNRLVEIVPGIATTKETVKAMGNFSFLSGKDPISCKDSNGFVVNRFFVPWLNEATRLLEEGIGTMESIDQVCVKTFGIGMGPFELMNATGIPVAYHAQKTLEVFGDFYKPSDKLKEQADLNQPWKLNENGTTPDSEAERVISERMLGVVFYVCSQMLDESICTATALNRGAKIGLRWKKGTVDLMRYFGKKDVERIIWNITDTYQVEFPESVGEEHWRLEFVTLAKSKGNAVITMSRPEDMNALNENVISQLNEKFDEADADPDINTIFITGAGKAFVAGADIKFFVQNIVNNSIEKVVEFTRYGHEVFDKIDRSDKKVVAILNGLAIGGGMELALCADMILAVPKATIIFPETGIGIYPGLGGTQRTTKRIGKGLAKWMILTGKPLNAKTALEIGLIDGIIQPTDIFEIMDGSMQVPEIEKFERSEKWQALSNLYEKNSYHSIVEGHYHNGGLDKEDVDKLAKTMSYKAPIAMDIAEKLIDECKGCEAELNELKSVFSTSDALLGLSSIGKRVKYEGK